MDISLVPKLLNRGFIFMAALVATIGTPVQATTVEPVILDLTPLGSRMSGVVTVSNTSTTDLPVEVSAAVADIGPNGLVASNREAEELLLFPPQATVPPGRTQSFRVQWVGEPDITGSRHFFVKVAQLPVKLPEGQSGVQLLYNFQVIVNVGPEAARPDIKATGAKPVRSADGKLRLVLDLQNSGANYGYFSDGTLRFVARDTSGNELVRDTLDSGELRNLVGFGLVAAEQTRNFVTPIELPASTNTIDVEYAPASRR